MALTITNYKYFRNSDKIMKLRLRSALILFRNLSPCLLSLLQLLKVFFLDIERKSLFKIVSDTA